MKNHKMGLFGTVILFFSTVGGSLLVLGCDKQASKANSGDQVTLLVQLSDFNVPADRFVLLNHNLRTKSSSVSQPFDFTDAVNRFGTNIDFQIDGHRYTKAIKLWSWQMERYQLLYVKNQKSICQKVIWDTQLQRILYMLESDLCWGADSNNLYAVKAFNLVSINPVNGASNLLFKDVSCFLKNLCGNEFLVFDLDGNMTCRNDQGAILKRCHNFHGIITGAGYINQETVMFYVRKNEYAKGHLAIMELDKLHLDGQSLELPQCSFLKALDDSKIVQETYRDKRTNCRKSEEEDR